MNTLINFFSNLDLIGSRWNREREIERGAFRRVPDASYASNIAMQAWNIGRTLERSFMYLLLHTQRSWGYTCTHSHKHSHSSPRYTFWVRHDVLSCSHGINEIIKLLWKNIRRENFFLKFDKRFILCFWINIL